MTFTHSVRVAALALMAIVVSGFADAGGPTLRIGCDGFPPNAFDPAASDRTGYDVDNILDAAEASGLEVEFAFQPWRRSIALTKQGQLDGLCVCSYRPDREKWLLYSDELGRTVAGIFLAPDYDGPEIRGFADLQNLRLGVVGGYNLEVVLRDRGVEALTVLDEFAGLRMLQYGRIDAYLGHWSVGRFYMSERNLDPGFPFIETDTTPYHLCVRRSLPNAEDVVRRFNQGLAVIRGNGTYDANVAAYGIKSPS